VLVMDSIYDALGIVKYNQLGEAVESQKAAVREQYEGTDQWMKAPNGEDTNLSEEQWLAVRTPAFKEWFGDWEADPENASKIVDENGEPLVVYHGTPLGGFTEFKRELNYFTADKEYADRYQDPGASSDYVKGVHEELGDAMTYPVFLNIRKPFDTRNPEEREIFENEFYRQWGNGAPLSEKGLPDWTDSDDFREFFEENEYDYDGLLLDEGGVPGEDGEVKSRGISYVAFESNQIKSATDNNGNYDVNDPNIYHQMAGGNKLERNPDNTMVNTSAVQIFDVEGTNLKQIKVTHLFYKVQENETENDRLNRRKAELMNFDTEALRTANISSIEEIISKNGVDNLRKIVENGEKNRLFWLKDLEVKLMTAELMDGETEEDRISSLYILRGELEYVRTLSRTKPSGDAKLLKGLSELCDMDVRAYRQRGQRIRDTYRKTGEINIEFEKHSKQGAFSNGEYNQNIKGAFNPEMQDGQYVS